MNLDLVTKPDFSRVAEEWQRFWRGERHRPLVGAVLPKAGVEAVPKPSTYQLGPDLDPQALAEQAVHWAETHEFVGAAVPFLYLEFAADQFATFLGADLKFPNPGEGGWPIHAYDKVPLWEVHVEFSTSGRWWRLIAELAEAIMDQGSHHLLLACPTMVANLDALVALRGAQKVLWDLVDCPGEVQRVLGEITAAHAQAVAAFGELLDYDRRGCINRHGMYCQGPLNVLQCDFSCMIGPAMFQEIVLPCLEAETLLYEAVEYHLDGPGALKHLEALCSLERLGVIQWVPGAADETRDWSDLFRRIDALGKGQLRGGSRAQLDDWAGQLRDRRVYWMLGTDSLAVACAAVENYA